jgi:hypothetical protein
MTVLADDDVVVDGNAERGGDLDDRLGHLDIGLRGRRIAGGMIVHRATLEQILSWCRDLCDLLHPLGSRVVHVSCAYS